MKKLIKADLSRVLELTADHQPVDRAALAAATKSLSQSRSNDYLFLVRKDRFHLMDLSEVYADGSDSNSFLAALETQTCWPVFAMLLHVECVEHGVHRGSVILADHSDLVRDVAFAAAHIREMVHRCVRYASQCTMMELITYLKTGRCD